INTGRTCCYSLATHVSADLETVSYDAVPNLPYQLDGCSAVSISADKTSPQPHGTTVTFTATATCPGIPTYKFWVKAPNGSWTVMQAYSTGNTFIWNSPATPGIYTIEVDVEDQGATDTYEKVTSTTFTLT